MEEFIILTKAQYAALSADDKKAYDKALAAFVAEWRTANPNGVNVEVTVTGLSNRPRTRKGSKSAVHAITFITDNELINAQIPNGVLLRPVANADIIASNAGFASFVHMAITLMGYANKGTLSFTLNLHVKGEEYAKGQAYTWTSFAQDDFEFLPSAAAGARIAKVTEAAAVKGFNDLMRGGELPSSNGIKVEESEEVEDDVEV